MAFDIGIADRLRAAGLKVVEVAGWQTRGSSTFNPRGSVDHHTAGARTGNAPSLSVCINGRGRPGEPGYLPGPLCHVLMGRDNTCYVIAAGRANHAGAGGWRGLTGNSSVYGLERENVGTTAEPWREDQHHAAALAHAALIKGRATADFVCRHAEWAPGRKVDTHSVDGDTLRWLVGIYLDRLNNPVVLPPVGGITVGAPVGAVDVVAPASEAGKIYVAGWAFDPDNPSASLTIHLYFDGILYSGITANTPRSDVNTHYGIPGDHGFQVVLSPMIKNHIEVYALDLTNPADNVKIGQGDIGTPVVNVAGVQGPKGDKGDKGEPGPVGPVGPAGDTVGGVTETRVKEIVASTKLVP